MKSKQKRCKPFSRWKYIIIHDENRILHMYSLDDNERPIIPLRTNKRRHLRREMELENARNKEKEKECQPVHQCPIVSQTFQCPKFSSQPNILKECAETKIDILVPDAKIDINNIFIPKVEYAFTRIAFPVNEDKENGKDENDDFLMG